MAETNFTLGPTSNTAEFMFISYTYIQVDKQGPRDDHQDNQLPKFKLGPGTWLAKARSPQEIEDYITT